MPLESALAMIATLLAIAAVAGPANRRGVSAAVYRALEGDSCRTVVNQRHGSQGGRRISRTLRAANLYVMTWHLLYD